MGQIHGYNDLSGLSWFGGERMVEFLEQRDFSIDHLEEDTCVALHGQGQNDPKRSRVAESNNKPYFCPYVACDPGPLPRKWPGALRGPRPRPARHYARHGRRQRGRNARVVQKDWALPGYSARAGHGSPEPFGRQQVCVSVCPAFPWARVFRLPGQTASAAIVKALQAATM